MRQLLLPLYEPCFPAPERAALTLLHASLTVVERVLRDAHPQLGDAPDGECRAPLVVAAARLIVGRCGEMRDLLALYDTALDEAIRPDDALPF